MIRLNDKEKEMKTNRILIAIILVLIILLALTHEGPTGDIPERIPSKVECDAFETESISCVDGETGESTPSYERCQEDEVLVPVQFDGSEDADYHCVVLDDFADGESIARLGEIIAEEQEEVN